MKGRGCAHTPAHSIDDPFVHCACMLACRYKTLEMRQTLETTLADVNKVDAYVSLQIFPHVQRQFQILVEDVDKISKTIMGYLQEYVVNFFVVVVVSLCVSACTVRNCGC